MCNLYRLHAGPAVIAQLFDVVAGIDGNRGDEVYPGYPGLVVADGVARTMTWGFPLVLKGRQGAFLNPVLQPGEVRVLVPTLPKRKHCAVKAAPHKEEQPDDTYSSGH